MLKKTIYSLAIALMLGLGTLAQFSDSDLLIQEVYNAEFPTAAGNIQLVDGTFAEYELLSYNILGDLDEVEGKDGVFILSQTMEDGIGYHLYAILSDASFPNIIATYFLGFDILILDMCIEDGIITVDFVAEAEENSLIPTRKSFVLNEGNLDIVFDGDLDEGHPFIADEVLSEEELSNIAYPLDWFDPTLHFVDGEFETVVGNETMQFEMHYQIAEIVYGDINGDETDDAMVFITVNAEEDGIGDSWLLASVLNMGGLPQVSGALVDRMGAGARLEELSIGEDGIIHFSFTEMTHQILVDYHLSLVNGELQYQD